MSKKPVGTRTCAACRSSFPQGEMTRFYVEDGVVKQGKGRGRGVYLCNTVKCRELAKKKKALQRAFHVQLPEAVYELGSKDGE